MKRITLLLLMCLTFVVNSFAGEQLKSLLDRVNNADYIFEGKVIKTNSYQTATSKIIYTSNVVQISKVFKGNLQCGTVEVITNGGTVNGTSTKNSHYIDMKEGTTGIFMCGQNEKELSATVFYNFSNSNKLTMIFEQQSLIKYILEGIDWKAYDVSQKFEDLATLYNYTQYLTQLNYIDCSDADYILNVPPVPVVAEYHFPVYQRSKYDSIMAQIARKISITSVRPHSSLRAAKTLTYTIQNPIITGTATKYFEFDIDLADDGTGYYINGALARISYPSAIFGSNLVGSGLIAVTRGALILDTTTYTDPTPADISANDIAIPISINVNSLGSLNLSPINTTPQQAVHVKMQIQNCNVAGSVTFTDQATMQLISYYGSYPNDTFGTNYDNIVATDSKAVPPCQATITSVSPTTVSGGIGDQITIRGFQFGAAQGNGNIMFRNADDGGASRVVLNTTDVIWTDTAITITVPSYNDTTMSSVGAIGYGLSKAGSGPIWIITDAGDRDSTIPITVFYSVRNDLITYSSGVRVKNPQDLIKKDINGGYKFSVDSTIWNTPAIKACVYKAVADWKCLTGVSWLMDTVIYGMSDTARLDSINFIQFGYTGYSPLGVIDANTTAYTANCGASTYTKEVDMVFNRATNWYFDTTSTASLPAGMEDFYADILHELGHAHSLNHIIDSPSVMFWASVPGPLLANQRHIFLHNDASCDYGGNKVIDVSLLGTYSACTTVLPIVPSYICTPFTGLHTLYDVNLALNAYPNPFSEYITLDYTVDRECTMDMYLMDLQGRIIVSYPSADISAGQHQKEIRTSNLSSGAYVVCGHVNGKSFYNKLICIH